MAAIGIALLVGVGAVAGTRLAASRSAPVAKGVAEGRLAACSSPGNCVSSSSNDRTRIEPLRCDGSDPLSALREEIAVRDWEILVEQRIGSDTYLHAVATTRLMGYRDDVEFVVTEGEPTIQVRSASRMGQGDLGANRQRLEDLRAALNARCELG